MRWQKKNLGNTLGGIVESTAMAGFLAPRMHWRDARTGAKTVSDVASRPKSKWRPRLDRCSEFSNAFR